MCVLLLCHFFFSLHKFNINDGHILSIFFHFPISFPLISTNSKNFLWIGLNGKGVQMTEKLSWIFQVLTVLTFAGPSLTYFTAFYIPIIPIGTGLTNHPTYPAPKPNKGHGGWPLLQASNQTTGDDGAVSERYVSLAEVCVLISNV